MAPKRISIIKKCLLQCAWLCVATLALADLQEGDIYELIGKVKARTSTMFNKDDWSNVKTVLGPGTRGKILKVEKYPETGNSGLLIEVMNGPSEHIKVWVHYNAKHPWMKLYKSAEEAEKNEPDTDVHDPAKARAVRTTRRGEGVLDPDSEQPGHKDLSSIVRELNEIIGDLRNSPMTAPQNCRPDEVFARDQNSGDDDPDSQGPQFRTRTARSQGPQSDSIPSQQRRPNSSDVHGFRRTLTRDLDSKSYSNGPTSTTLIPSSMDTFPNENIAMYLQPSDQVQSQDPVITQHAVTTGTDMQKLLAVHDWVAKNFDYDINYYNDWATIRGTPAFTEKYKDLKVDARTILSTMPGGKAFCAGIANATAALLRASNIPARVILGTLYFNRDGTIGTDNPNCDERLFNHNWVQAFVNGKWISMDTTMDVGGSEGSPPNATFKKNTTLSRWSLDGAEFEAHHKCAKILNQ